MASPVRWDNRAIFYLLWPLIIEQILGVTMGIADTVMVSSVGEYAVSGVSLVDVINNLLILAFAALATGGSVVVSQYIGRRDTKNSASAARQLIYANTIISIVITLAALIVHTWILRLVYGNVEADVMKAARTYFWITALSYPFLAIYNSAAALFRAMGNSRVPMLIALLVNCMNIGGNAIFIFGLHIGVAGAALSTLISRVVAAVILLFLLISGAHSSGPASLKGLSAFRLDPRMIRNILNIGVPSGVENSMFQFGKILVSRIFTSFGTAAIAANAIVSVTNSLSFMPGQAFGIALLTIVGQCVGAGDYEGAKRYAGKILKLCYVVLIILNGSMLIFMDPLISLFNLSAEAQTLAKGYMRVQCISASLFWTLGFTLPNALRAAGDVQYCMVVGAATMWLVRVIAAYILAYPLGFGSLGVWIAMGLDFVARTVLYTTRWVRGKWQYKTVIGEG
ncbi:MATE family efflux transporter [Treponema primitia]|uniref:MATE family efflux transporter n=1 Tax=Treponema primitia TaxID=88058 RepID=UPI000255518E|nr:MATE family efflux transporter [Treponema primitia]